MTISKLEVLNRLILAERENDHLREENEQLRQDLAWYVARVQTLIRHRPGAPPGAEPGPLFASIPTSAAPPAKPGSTE